LRGGEGTGSVMQHVIIAIHLMVVIALVALVLYQKSEGGALGLGQSGFFTGRGQANALTRATAILATIFFLTSLLLTALPAWERRVAVGEDWTKAVDQGPAQVKEVKPPVAAPAEEKPASQEKESIFEQLKRAQEKRQSTTTPAPAPAAPAGEAPLRPSVEEPAKSEAAPAAEAKPDAPKETSPQSQAGPATPASKPASEENKPAENPQASTPEAPSDRVAPNN
jgi:protein translocase SecG subunit